MKTILSLVLFLIIGFAGSKGFVRKSRSRFPLPGLYVTGMDFFFVGILLGPNILDVITPAVIQDLKPIIYLALGWAGFLVGLEMTWPQLKRVSKPIYQFLIMDALLIIMIFSLLSSLLLHKILPGIAGSEKVFAGFLLAITAAASSPAIVAIQARRLPSRGRFTRMVKLSSALSTLVPLLLFGLFYTILHPGFFETASIGKGLLWWIFANAVGIVLGFVAVLFTVERCSDDERTLIIMGTVMLIGGLCYYFTISSLYTAMIVGIVVGNFSSRRELIFRQLLQFEKTLFVAFLIIVGAMVSFDGLRIYLLLFCYLALRLLSRTFLSSWLVGLTHPEFRSIGMSSGLAFSAQGAIALAIGIEYKMGTSGAFTETIFTVVAFAVVLNEILAFGLTRRSFLVSGKVAAERKSVKEADT